MKNLKEFLKRQGWISILSSLVLGILGIILIMRPIESLNFISTILGGMFIIVGLYKIIIYFMNKARSDFYDNEIATGIITCTIGIVIMTFSKELESILRIIIGIGIIYKSIINIDLSFRLKHIESKIWVFSLVMGIIMLTCGIYVVFTPSALIVTIGTILLVNAIIDIIDNVLFINDIRHY